jgi:hypothetical protein
MVAHRAAPHGPTFTCAPSCASQRPLGSADAAPAHQSADTIPPATAQGSFIIPILSAFSAPASPNLNIPIELCAKKAQDFRPGLGSSAR